MSKNIQSWFMCSCGCKALHVIYDKEDNEVYLSMYGYGTVKRTSSLSYKLGMIWKLLREGTPYEDNLILEMEDVNRLKHLCESILKRANKGLNK